MNELIINEHLIDRGRGPEIKGTRVTVYRILDFVRDGSSPERMAQELDLSAEQVQAALDYIAAHKEEVDAVYETILARVNQGNPPWVEALLAKSPGGIEAAYFGSSLKREGQC
jgi:uncharacterized protein (DUF433 family)